MSLSREETLALAAVMQGVWEMMSHLSGGSYLAAAKDEISSRRDELLRSASFPTGDEEPDDGEPD